MLRAHMLAWLQNYSRQILRSLPANRLLALDVFRGLTITAMVLVNNPGSWSHVYGPLLHAKWHGWTPTDLIFPFFVFMIGISVSIVMTHELAKGTQKRQLLWSAAVRGVKLFLLGLFLALFYFNFVDPNFSWIESQLLSIRVMGVLQRLGLVFFFTVAIVAYFKPLGRFVCLLALLLGYFVAMLYLPYNLPTGESVVGELAFGNNLQAWFDAWIFSSNHVYYGDASPFHFDPEGLLSTLPAIGGALMGVFTGDLLLDKTLSTEKKCRILLLAGILGIAIGELWGLVFPINKSLWTSSFVVMSTGWASLLLGLLVWLLDIKRITLWSAPFVVFGANAIAFYMLSAVLARSDSLMS